MDKGSLVIDCSLIVKWFCIEDHSDFALSFLKEAEGGTIKLFAPSIILIEFANVLRKQGRLKSITNEKCINFLIKFIEICKAKIIHLINQEEFILEIFDLASQNNLSYYDGEYLYLAKMLKVDLITFDKNLKKAFNK